MKNNFSLLCCAAFPILLLILTVMVFFQRGVVAGTVTGVIVLPITFVFGLIAYIERKEKNA